ncbi:MAG: protein-export chaperone SecB [Bacteroidales bacterium]|nr:protein-export chaperone SecB [Bacteroidales bacterium]MBR4625344.1 protein-export chaperone SecB [Alphaproteobacteria bacterium]
MVKKIAKFRFKGFRVLESSFKCTSELPNEPENFDVDLMPSFRVAETANSVKLTLETKVRTENSLVDIYVKAESMFEFDDDLNDEEQQLYFRKNAPAIMFPYVRAYISSLSVLSGIPPITLPTINLAINSK